MKEDRKWITILTELKMDNVQLKDWLSKAISGQVSSDFVEKAELFQQQFIEKDLVIDLLRRDIVVLREETSVNEMTDEDKAQYKMLEKAVKQLQVEFQKMKLSFIAFLNRSEFS
ncbi:hypothetical protein [Niabella beijingensis]|uniref:hypothetical protein n=1 Tax=Niabella beijingensis TaxID=2872700 RepID=UPI001CBBC2E3|nr:hypothetical protein [Niabella beijingensis]MBZ4191620.1 hypothetical protein [Niabella beijingensis]